MHLSHLRLRDFRNYARLDAEFMPGFHLLLGQNAQGKTNLLEALYLLATLRSFRGVGGAQMVRYGQSGYFVGGKAVAQATHTVRLYWSLSTRSLTLDGQPVRRLSDYFGLIRMVVFCAEDLQLVKGPAERRRRFLDLLLAQTQPDYLPLWQQYRKALRSRNVLLRQRTTDEAAVESFTRELVRLGLPLMQRRRELAPRLGDLARLAYQRIAFDAEALRLEYRPGVRHDFAVELAQSRAREQTFRSTLVGPHRDDLELLLDEKSAGQFASEGQKRTLALALKLAQAEYLLEARGTPPILLIDDVMGELDAQRRAGFVPLLTRAREALGQVFMTCTEENWPRELGCGFQRWEVQAGTLKPTSA